MSTVDREKDCPFLLRVFTRQGGHNSIHSYSIDNVPENELTLYTWKNATLEEIAQLIEQVIPEARDPDARISFRLVYLNKNAGRFFQKDIGRVVSAKPTRDQKKTLEESRFMIGDYLDVAIFIGPPPAIARDQRRDTRGSRDMGRFNTGRPAMRTGDRRGSYGRDYVNNNRFGGGARPRRDY
ncbi:hypothetical protein G6F29_003165 [Rhizopus arrhizus]|uniref:Histone deacetylase complex subunit SAP18 n=1 Tax=Rhizopus oryzae TaxID=64495 RepID=A0A9P6X3K5_RHIOR|nr:hypothetical protein G6F23_013380 [Rhizopus arrhizus]KAG0769809.1 hypothetical protein G6F24_000776 [Rhizopus arrhizus]KAG0785030.1 hypothetical protein G6F21_009519 [Rhizopus arrhizus]KAG0817031.1 hypothetical protein G6F20_002727 [Rhizopus arrhizus]KAG0824921.1 hypothetical protein G6F19_010075 [Rhizopus arrhizus]